MQANTDTDAFERITCELLPHLRYQAIMFPLRFHITKSRAKVMILIIWVLSTVLAVPMGIAYKILVVSRVKSVSTLHTL